MAAHLMDAKLNALLLARYRQQSSLADAYGQPEGSNSKIKVIKHMACGYRDSHYSLRSRRHESSGTIENCGDRPIERAAAKRAVLALIHGRHRTVHRTFQELSQTPFREVSPGGVGIAAIRRRQNSASPTFRRVCCAAPAPCPAGFQTP